MRGIIRRNSDPSLRDAVQMQIGDPGEESKPPIYPLITRNQTTGEWERA